MNDWQLLADLGVCIGPGLALGAIFLIWYGEWKLGLIAAGLFGVAGAFFSVADRIAYPEMAAENGLTTTQTALMGMCIAPLVIVAIGAIIAVISGGIDGAVERATRHRPRNTPINLMAGKNPHNLLDWDDSVIEAAEILEQRKSGRRLGGNIHVTLRKGAPYDTRVTAKFIHQQGQRGCDYGVRVDFEDPQDRAYADIPFQQPGQ